VCESIRETVAKIAATPISPELKPTVGGEISQRTEDILGPYELHDFFLFHFLNSGFSREKLTFIAQTAFKGQYDLTMIQNTVDTFFTRFRLSQFKRNASPDGPKVLSVSLHSRSDWRMPSDLETGNIF
jgi:NAD+ synthase (glutamine-hydrolysing)